VRCDDSDSVVQHARVRTDVHRGRVGERRRLLGDVWRRDGAADSHGIVPSLHWRRVSDMRSVNTIHDLQHGCVPSRLRCVGVESMDCVLGMQLDRLGALSDPDNRHPGTGERAALPTSVAVRAVPSQRVPTRVCLWRLGTDWVWSMLGDVWWRHHHNAADGAGRVVRRRKRFDMWQLDDAAAVQHAGVQRGLCGGRLDELRDLLRDVWWRNAGADSIRDYAAVGRRGGVPIVVADCRMQHAGMRTRVLLQCVGNRILLSSLRSWDGTRDGVLHAVHHVHRVHQCVAAVRFDAAE
jgi:hypothetical protein